MRKEVDSLYKNHTWDLVPLPKGYKTICCRWIFKKKETTHVSYGGHYKARLISKGHNQNEGINLNQIFSYVARHTLIRVLLAMEAFHDIEFEQVDVKTVFYMKI